MRVSARFRSYIVVSLMLGSMTLLAHQAAAVDFSQSPNMPDSYQVNVKGKSDTAKQATVAVKPRALDLKPIPAQRLERLAKEARDKYAQGLQYINKINYEKAIACFEAAVDLQAKKQDDVYLRFMVVQVAQYLGDIRIQGDSVKYYDKAITQLKIMSVSDQLNTREKQRVLSALESVKSLQQAVGERDDKRHKTGEEIARAWAKETYKSQDEAARAREEKKQQVQTYVKAIGYTAFNNNNTVTPGQGGSFSQLGRVNNVTR